MSNIRPTLPNILTEVSIVIMSDGKAHPAVHPNKEYRETLEEAARLVMRLQEIYKEEGRRE